MPESSCRIRVLTSAWAPPCAQREGTRRKHHHTQTDTHAEEGLRHGLHERLNVVLKKLHHEEHGVLRAHHHLARKHDILVARLDSFYGLKASRPTIQHSPNLEQRVDFPERRDGEALLEVVALELFQRVDCARGAVARAENHAVRALVNQVEALILVDAAAALQQRKVWR
jgi:hypothetical protein